MPRLKTLEPRLKTLAPKVANRTASTDRPRGSGWMTTRERILRRDCGICRCAECKRTGALKPAHEVDHVIPRDKGGSDDDSNLQAINYDCHKAKTKAEAAAR